MGIDAGSTTLKAVLIDKDGAILREWYGSHRGNVISRAKEILLAMYEVLPSQCCLAGVGVTGYGEGLLRKAFCLDTGKWKLWRIFGLPDFFCPEVTALFGYRRTGYEVLPIKRWKDRPYFFKWSLLLRLRFFSGIFCRSSSHGY